MRKTALFFITVSITLFLFGCFIYQDMEFDNPYDPTDQDGISLEYRDDIVIDGDTSEWGSVGELITDKTYEQTINTNLPLPQGSDLFQIKAAQDDNNLYFYVETTDGAPLITPGLELGLNFNNPDDNFNLINLRHDTSDGVTSNGYFNIWSNYGYDDGSVGWANVPLNNPGIRYTGINTSSTSMEIGISKATYWDQLYTQKGYDFVVSTWYQNYENIYTDGGCDNSNDENDVRILLKGVTEAQPAMDSPIVQFPHPSVAPPTCDDNSLADIATWEEFGIWYQDFQGDKDPSVVETNKDIDKVYVLQDNNFIYLLLTFFDNTGGFLANSSVSIYVEQESGAYGHEFYGQFDGSNWIQQLNYAGGDSDGHLGGSATGFIEFRFDKYLVWPDLAYEPCYFNIEVRDSGGTVADRVQFMGMYKAEGEPTPVNQL